MIGLIWLISCSRERIEPTQQLNSYEPIDDYLDSKKQEEQEFEITEEGDSPIQGLQGTKIWIAKDLLMFPDSSDVDFPFTVKLVELYTAKDMIYYQLPTVERPKILETDGEIRVRVFKEDENGVVQELLLKPDRVFAIEMPTDSVREDMKVYYGYTLNNKPDWTADVSDVNGNSADLYFTENSNSYSAFIGKLGWINCGKPHLGFNGLTFTSETDELDNVGIFVYQPTYQTVSQAYALTSDNFEDSTFVKVIAMGINSDNELFYTYLGVELNSSGSIPITLESISDDQLTALLDSL